MHTEDYIFKLMDNKKKIELKFTLKEMYKPANKSIKANQMESYYAKLFSTSMAKVVENYWEMEKYNFESVMYNDWEEFEKALLDSPFCSLIVFKFNGNKDKMNECVSDVWKESYTEEYKDGKTVTYQRTTDFDKKFFPEDITNLEEWFPEILVSQLEYETRDCLEKLGENIKEFKNKGKVIKNRKAHYLAFVKTHPLYDLIVLKSKGNLKAIHEEVFENWN